MKRPPSRRPERDGPPHRPGGGKPMMSRRELAAWSVFGLVVCAFVLSLLTW